MSEFINTAKEIFCGDAYFKDHVMPPDFNWRIHKKELSPYFAERGFKVSMMYNDFYSRLNGIHTDKYVSMDLYYFYLLPSLNRHDFMDAYTDKSIYSVLFAGIRQPETVVKCMNGHFFDGDGNAISSEDALRICRDICRDTECIIKPTVMTCNGDGVDLLDGTGVEVSFRCHGKNFIVQKKVCQHPDMAALNESSLNSLRVFTYRDLRGTLHLLDCVTCLRIGGRGAIKDNASSGGEFCGVNSDGCLSTQFWKFKSMSVGAMADINVVNFRVPAFESIKALALRAHSRLPYFDFIGWDIAVDSGAEPVLVEFNVLPSCEMPQIANGSVFGDFISEVMDRAACVSHEVVAYQRNVFGNGFDHLMKVS